MQAAERKRERRERDAEGARTAILAAAEAIFARDGFSGARVEAIAASAGYNKALIFHYFDDKITLYRTLIAHIKRENGERIFDLMRLYFPDDGVPLHPSRVREFIAAAVRWTFDMYLSHPGLPRMLAWEAAEGWQTYAACPASPGQASWMTSARDLIRRAQAVRIVRADVDPEMLIANIMGMSLIYLISLPRYRGLFPEKNLDSAEAKASAREQLVSLVLVGVLDTSSTDSSQEAPGEAQL
jgi:TetR/AcrR family transcriptional regulator